MYVHQGIRFTSGWTQACIYAANNICPQSDNIELVTLEIRKTARFESAF